MEAAKLYRPAYGHGGFRGQRLLQPKNSNILFQGSVPSYWLLRFYIPPATEGLISFNLTCPQNAMIGTVARLGIVPQGENYSTNRPANNTYINYPWQTRSGTCQELRDQDWIVCNTGGTISIMADYYSTSLGEWLFVKIIFNGRNPGNLGANLNIQVDPVAYQKWYSTMQWDSDGNPPLDWVSDVPTIQPPIIKPELPTQGETIMPIQELTGSWPTKPTVNLTPEQIQEMKDKLLAQLLGTNPGQISKVEPEETTDKKPIMVIYEDGTWVSV